MNLLLLLLGLMVAKTSSSNGAGEDNLLIDITNPMPLSEMQRIIGKGQRLVISGPLLLTVYYESKCPDSKKFIVDQLVPTINQMQDYLHLKLIPFGKAKNVNQGNAGFECQHGPTECLGNMVQDCAINLMSGRSYAEIVNYVACEMQSMAGTTGNLECVLKAQLPVQKVQQCINSRQGILLQLNSEHLTHLLRPKFIPTITINGHFDQHIQDQSQENLLGTLCEFLPEATPCAQHYVALGPLVF